MANFCVRGFPEEPGQEEHGGPEGQALAPQIQDGVHHTDDRAAQTAR
jgi:hypothetical protein